MAKNTFLDWDTTANNNSDVGGVNIAEGCAPSGINNGMRTIMAQLRSGVDGKMVYVTKSANYTALGTDNGSYYRFTASATLSLTAVATLAANWHMWVKADGGDVTVDPNGAETINGAATLVIRNGESALIVSSGSAFFANLAPTNTPFTYSVKTANYTALDGDYNTTFRFTSAATLAFDVTANLRTNWRIEVWNDSTGLVIIDPDSTNTINGSTTLAIQPGQRMEIYKTSSTAFQGAFYADTYSGPQLQGYYFGLGLTTATGDATNDVTVAAGAIAASSSPYNLLQLTSAITKQVDAAWAVGNNAGGLDTGSVGNNTYYIIPIGRPDTGVVDILLSLSATAPTMPANYTLKGPAIGFFTRTAGVNGPITWLTTSALGVGQVYVDVTASRVAGTSYQNTGTRPILVIASATATTAGRLAQISTDNFVADAKTVAQLINASPVSISFIVLPGSYYRVSQTAAANIGSWLELR